MELTQRGVQAAKVMIHVRKVAACSVPVTQLFNTPTISGLAEALERLHAPASAAPQAIPEAGYMPEQRAAGVPCSANQEQMLVLHAMLLDSSTYNVVDGMRLRGALDAAALQVGGRFTAPCIKPSTCVQSLTLTRLPCMQAALACLVARHEALRTRFEERDAQVLQAVLPASDSHAKLPLQRLSLPGGGAPGELARLLAELTERPHQLLGAGVPARFVLLELGPDSHILHINMHHISRSALLVFRQLTSYGRISV